MSDEPKDGGPARENPPVPAGRVYRQDRQSDEALWRLVSEAKEEASTSVEGEGTGAEEMPARAVEITAEGESETEAGE